MGKTIQPGPEQMDALVAAWGQWWNEVIFSDRPGPSKDWDTWKAYEAEVKRLGLRPSERLNDRVSDAYQNAVWKPREAMYGGAHRRGLGS